MIALSTLVAFFLVLAVSLGYYLSAPAYRGSTSDHFNGKTFQNPGNVKAKGLGEVIRWLIGREQGEWKPITNAVLGEKPAEQISSGIRITFVNHSTFLIQTEGLNILTDPVWSERTSPFTFAGPKRMRPPGILLQDLPQIDVILISHNHYDHLDVPTMQQLVAQHKPRIITPLGVKEYLEQEQLKGATDVDWWQEIRASDSLTVQAVPAQHFSGRGMFDRDKTLWCGYVLKRKGGNLYFAGDTGYNHNTFTEIGERCAPLLVSILPIGAYKPNWFMSPIHTSPADAVQLFIDSKTKYAVASHFGTFALADDGQQEPIENLTKALREHNLTPAQFSILKEGAKADFEL